MNNRSNYLGIHRTNSLENAEPVIVVDDIDDRAEESSDESTARVSGISAGISGYSPSEIPLGLLGAMVARGQSFHPIRHKPEVVQSNSLQVEVVGQRILITGKCGTSYEMTINNFVRLKRRIDEAYKQNEILHLKEKVATAEKVLREESQKLYELEHPQNLGFHFPC